VRLGLIVALLIGFAPPVAAGDEPASPDDVRPAPPPPLIAPPIWAPPLIAPPVDAPIEVPVDAPVEVPSLPRVASAAITGALRAGLYADGDQTFVFRALGAIAAAWRSWTIQGGVSVDVISSSSIDVRSSAGLSKVDVVTRASHTSTSGGKMFDRRILATLGAGWHRNDGRAVAWSVSYANENDYNSVGLNLNGSVDVFHRMTTLLGGLSFTHNWIASVLDRHFAQTMFDLSWTAGVAQVLGQKDALRLRYDGTFADGYQASPYRSVRFGDWTTSVGSNQQILFSNTIGSSGGLPENEPTVRVRHALSLEWLHSLTPKLSLFPQLRLGIDSWGLKSASPGVELRAAWTNWRLQLGYRFYIQSAVDFYQAKYDNDPSTYTYFTSDKELSPERGHISHLDVSRVLRQPRYVGDPRILIDLHFVGLYYQYTDFVLLGSRWSVFADLGVTWE
jgi:hypothetical protein